MAAPHRARNVLRANVALLGVFCFALSTGCASVTHGLIPKTAGGSSTIATTNSINPAIKNVIVVIFENRSFDNMFQFLDHSQANIANISGTAYSYGTPVTLQSQTLAASTYDVGHSHSDFLRDYDQTSTGPKNDGWPTGTDTAYAYVPKSEVQPDLDIANEFAISDNFFHGITAPTFPSHVEIGGASTYGVIDNPSDEVWGCDASPGTTTGLFDPNMPNQEDPTGGPFPCFDELSIFDLLDRGGISWFSYDEPQGVTPTGNENIPGFYRQIRYGPDWTTKIGTSDAEILTALVAGGATSTLPGDTGLGAGGPTTLPQVSFVIPDDASTDHAGTPSLGPMYLEALVNAFGESSYFNNTLMIITWDDWGGWYDHVTPPVRPNGTNLGFRKPIIFVGGLVKKGIVANGVQEAYVSHVQTEDASIAKTIEDIYHLGSLGQDDVGANDFNDVIMPAGATPAPFTPITSVEEAAPSTPVDAPVGDRPGRRHVAPFRVIPPNAFNGQRDAAGHDFDASKDYYGKQSADY
jgi:phospholipase C